MDAGVGSFGFLEFALVGVPLLAGTMAIIILFGQKLLPERNGATMPTDFSRHAKTLVEQYGLATDVYQMRVRASSPYVGARVSAVDLGAYPGLQLVGIHDGETARPVRKPIVSEGDYLLLRGDAEAAAALAADQRLAFREEVGQGGETLFNRRSGLAEVVIPPRSGLIGKSVFPGMVTESGDLIILAVQRGGTELPAGGSSEKASGIVLQAGDTMLLQGTWTALDVHLDDPDVLVVSSPELVRRQAVPMGPGAHHAIAILLGMVFLLATGIVPPPVAGLLAAGAVILTRIMTVEQSYRAIGWTTVILVGAMMPLSTAMVETGAAKLMAERLVYMVADAGPLALLAGLFVLTAIMGQLISNTATALIVIPIGVAAAEGMGISARPVLMSTAVAAAAAFLTPIATPTNLMVMGPGGYAFGDYWKLGLPLLIWFFAISVFVVPLIWAF